MNNLLLPATIEQARNVDIVQLVGRRVKLTRKGRVFWGLCPFHKENDPSFKVENERRSYHCFGCGADGDAIDWVIATERLSFVDAVLSLTGQHTAAALTPLIQHASPPCPAQRDEKDEKAREFAHLIWNNARESKGTPVEAYLRARGIRQPPSAELRYAPALDHRPSKRSFPAMIARVSDDRGFCGIQRTYLAADSPAKTDVSPNKMTLAPMYGGAVRLRMPFTETLGIAEGIETALSAAQLYSFAVWATLSANRLGMIEVPKRISNIIIFADAGDVGRREAFAAADVYERRGLITEVIFPAADFRKIGGEDFNEILREAR